MPPTLRRAACLVIFLATLVLGPPLHSQDASTGAIRGTVLDPGGQAVVAATVAVLSTTAGVTRSVLTDTDGRFAFELLPPGDYSARAEIKGMSPQVSPHPLWPQAGKVPFNNRNFSPRIGPAYSFGREHPSVVRAGYGLFYTRIPQIYTSTIATDNGLTSANLFLDNMNYYQHQIMPAYPNELAPCPTNSAFCAPPANAASYLSSEVASFAPNFVTPRVHQASLNVERELTDRFAAGISYMYVHGQNMIRAPDVNLPIPTDVTYPVYDETGINFLGAYYNVPTFSSWQMTRSMTCPYPPCINPSRVPFPNSAPSTSSIAPAPASTTA